MSVSEIISNMMRPAIDNQSSVTTLGVVTGSDETNNTCDVQYVDKDGRKRNKEGVVVRLYGNGGDWFPAIKDVVVLENSSDSLVCIARHVGNYNMDVRSKMQLRQDIYSDSSGGATGGQIG